MNRPAARLVVVAALLIFAGLSADSFAETEEPSRAGPPIEDLGNDRYRIGAITVDKGARSFTVGGTILHLDKPLEYLAVKRNGAKGYESLLELDTLAVEFQLACILVGLDEEKSVKPRFQFDENEVVGQSLDITLSWTENDETKTIKASNALKSGDETFDDHEWAYVGSVASPQDGSLLAEGSGTLIGFVHDPLSVIEHRKGTGFGAYGRIRGNAALLPAEGTPVTLTVLVVPEE